MPEPVPVVSPITPVTQTAMSGGVAPEKQRVSQLKADGPKSWLVIFLISSTISLVTVFLFFLFLSNDTWFAWRQLISRHIFRSEYITYSSKEFDRNQYVVGKAMLQKSGYLVLFLGVEYDSGMRDPVAASGLLLPGVYTNIQLKADNAHMVYKDVSTFRSGSSLYVALYHDNGDGQLNITSLDSPKDALASDYFGHSIITKLTIQ